MKKLLLTLLLSGMVTTANALPDWVLEAKDKAQAEEKVKKAKKPSKYHCGKKRLCGEMDSCEEAKYHLKECGLTRLDRNKDGVPCESICK
jgi:hypothetical protein